jgi:hypothetical protein
LTCLNLKMRSLGWLSIRISCRLSFSWSSCFSTLLFWCVLFTFSLNFWLFVCFSSDFWPCFGEEDSAWSSKSVESFFFSRILLTFSYTFSEDSEFWFYFKEIGFKCSFWSPLSSLIFQNTLEFCIELSLFQSIESTRSAWNLLSLMFFSISLGRSLCLFGCLVYFEISV